MPADGQLIEEPRQGRAVKVSDIKQNAAEQTSACLLAATGLKGMAWRSTHSGRYITRDFDVDIAMEQRPRILEYTNISVEP